MFLKESRDLLILVACPDSTDFLCFLSISLRSSVILTFRQYPLPPPPLSGASMASWLGSWLSSSWSASVGAVCFRGDVRTAAFLDSFFPFLLPIVLKTTLNTVLIQTCSIHCDVCVPFVSSSTTSGLLYCGWAEKSMTSSGDDRAIGVRWPDGDRTDICRSPSDYFPFIHTARSPSDLRVMIARWPGGDRPIFGNIFPRKIGRRPGGRRRMAKLPQESADHPANFNCKLNFPDRRRMRAQGVLNRRMAVGFLQDSSPGSPHGDPAIDFSLLWRSFNQHMLTFKVKVKVKLESFNSCLKL